MEIRVSKDCDIFGDQRIPGIYDSMIYICRLGVMPLFQSKGIGDLIMNFIIEKAKENPKIKLIALHAEVCQF